LTDPLPVGVNGTRDVVLTGVLRLSADATPACQPARFSVQSQLTGAST
jgi:hypothetical protein